MAQAQLLVYNNALPRFHAERSVMEVYCSLILDILADSHALNRLPEEAVAKTRTMHDRTFRTEQCEGRQRMPTAAERLCVSA